MRDLALARLVGARVHFQHLSTAGSVALVAAARQRGQAVTAEATPASLHAHRTRRAAATTRCSRSIRRCAPMPTCTPFAPAWPTERSTPSPPITRRTPPQAKELPFDQAPPGMLGLGDRPRPGPHRARPADRGRARPHGLAAGAHRRAGRRTARTAGGGTHRRSVRDRPGDDLGRRPARAGQSLAQHRHSPGARSPAAPATRSWPASRS